jgi:hypothetical protein
MKEREFYLKNAGRTSNHLGKAMLQQIAWEFQVFSLDNYREEK